MRTASVTRSKPARRPSRPRCGDRRGRVKTLALDFGSARTGVAVSDPTGIIARPLCVVERASSEDGLAELERLVRDEGAEQIVVGHPLTLRGERGDQARASEQFAKKLRERLEVPVVL